MKTNIIMLLVAIAVVTGCSKKNDNISIPVTPRSNVPANLSGQWLNGTFAMANWWSFNGTQWEGNPYARSTAFNFLPNGDAEFYQTIETYDGYCHIQAFTWMKGTVVVNETARSIKFYPQQGNYRGFYSCASGSNFSRDATASELQPSVYYYTIETDVNGKTWMVIHFEEDQSDAGSWFNETTW